THDTGAGSLLQALLDANSTVGADTIAFTIPGAGTQLIHPLSQLPAITDPVTIDGYTQPLATKNTLAVGDNANLLIVLDGFPPTVTGIDGLIVNSGGAGSAIRGLVINGFVAVGSAGGDGIRVNANNVTIDGNFIGITADG